MNLEYTCAVCCNTRCCSIISTGWLINSSHYPEIIQLHIVKVIALVSKFVSTCLFFTVRVCVSGHTSRSPHYSHVYESRGIATLASYRLMAVRTCKWCEPGQHWASIHRAHRWSERSQCGWSPYAVSRVHPLHVLNLMRKLWSREMQTNFTSYHTVHQYLLFHAFLLQFMWEQLCITIYIMYVLFHIYFPAFHHNEMN